MHKATDRTKIESIVKVNRLANIEVTQKGTAGQTVEELILRTRLPLMPKRAQAGRVGDLGLVVVGECPSKELFGDLPGGKSFGVVHAAA